MAGYTKNIAVIKGIKSGFSSDGGALSGLIKAEKYGSFFRAEASLINFAPLVSGRYVVAVSDGAHTVSFDGESFECESEIETAYGFAALVCYVGAEVSPVAMAVCGDYGWATAVCARYIEDGEKIKNMPEAGAAYEDEAIAEENYFEYGSDNEGEGAVRACKEQKDGRGGREDEDARGACKEREGAEKQGEGELNFSPAQQNAAEYAKTNGDSRSDKCKEDGGESAGGNGGNGGNDGNGGDGGSRGGDAAEPIPLATDLKFYERVRGEVEKLLAEHKSEEALERAVENSRWVKISYGGKRFYVFGVIYENSSPAYICYGVPAMGSACPSSLSGMAGFIPVAEAGNDGYWVMYQDARTGASIKLNSV